MDDLMALELARSNIAAAGMEDRIDLREQRIEEITDIDVYDTVWLASKQRNPSSWSPTRDSKRCGKSSAPGPLQSISWLVARPRPESGSR